MANRLTRDPNIVIHGNSCIILYVSQPLYGAESTDQVLGKITDQFLYFNDATVEVKKWLSNFIHHFTRTCEYLSMLGLKLIHVSKRGPWGQSIHSSSFIDYYGREENGLEPVSVLTVELMDCISYCQCILDKHIDHFHNNFRCNAY